MFDARLPTEKVQSVLEHVAEGCGVRQTGRPPHGRALQPDRRRARPRRPRGGPPLTTEVQFDEKWAFVAKKEKNCDRDDPADDHKGDYWDHVAFDPEHKLVVAVVPGARAIENTEALVEELRRRTGAGS